MSAGFCNSLSKSIAPLMALLTNSLSGLQIILPCLTKEWCSNVFIISCTSMIIKLKKHLD